MVVLPDGTAFEMSWKQVKYINHEDFIVFQIVPMLQERDMIIVPNKKSWKSIQTIFPMEEREEIVFLLKHISWKRDICIREIEITPHANREFLVQNGMIETTMGYHILTKENLFDVDGKLNKEQVKDVYCKLERKFAKMSSGIVNIAKDMLIKGSITNEISVPKLKENVNVKLEIK